MNMYKTAVRYKKAMMPDIKINPIDNSTFVPVYLYYYFKPTEIIIEHFTSSEEHVTYTEKPLKTTTIPTTTTTRRRGPLVRRRFQRI